MATSENQPRIRTMIEKHYSLIPQSFKGMHNASSLYTSLHRYPIENAHWKFETIMDRQGRTLMLDSIKESHFDDKERCIHYFLESREKIDEASYLYIEPKEGDTIVVLSESDGHTSVTYGELEWNLYKGQFYNHSGIFMGLERELTPAQRAYMDEQDGLLFKDTTEEEQEEFERKQQEVTPEIIIQRDQYGNPLVVEHWFCDEIEEIIVFNYIYDKERVVDL